MSLSTIEGLTIRWQPWTVQSALIHLWQSSLVGLAILVLIFVARKASARTRWMIGMFGLLKFLLPLIWFNSTISRLPLSMGALSRLPGTWVPSVGAHLPGPSHPASGSGPAQTAPDSSPVLVKAAAAFWLSIASVLIAGDCCRGLRFRKRVLAAAEPISPRLRNLVEKASLRVGLEESPICVTTDEISGPGILGILSPILVLPRSLEDSLSRPEIDAILVHEMVHLKRRDGLVISVQALIVRLFWFDPVIWLLDRSLRLELEKSCDETVLNITADAKSYADGILKMVRQSLGPTAPGFAGAAGVSIVERMENILSRSADPRRRRPMALLIGAASCLVVFSGFSGEIRTEAVAGTSPGRALLVGGFESWERVPDFRAELGDLGYRSAVIKSADMATTDLSPYSLIVIPGTQLQTDVYSDYARAEPQLDQFVQHGGTLLLEVKGAEGMDILRERLGAIPFQQNGHEFPTPTP